jgi:hypothetical protein
MTIEANKKGGANLKKGSGRQEEKSLFAMEVQKWSTVEKAWLQKAEDWPKSESARLALGGLCISQKLSFGAKYFLTYCTCCEWCQQAHH